MVCLRICWGGEESLLGGTEEKQMSIHYIPIVDHFHVISLICPFPVLPTSSVGNHEKLGTGAA